MKITFAAVSAYDKNHHILTIASDKDETIKVGQIIPIELTNEAVVDHEIVAMRKWELKPNAKLGKWRNVDSISDGESCEADVYGIEGKVQTTSMPLPAERKRFTQMINVMPYKEIKGGIDSIFEHIDESVVVPDKVIAYLQTTKPYCVCMGLYKHPFKDQTLTGPYWYTDGEYFWDRDAWKYVIKYHVTLPKPFTDKVMSEQGTAFLKSCDESDDSWSNRIQALKKHPNMLCLLSDDAGDYSLDDF